MQDRSFSVARRLLASTSPLALFAGLAGLLAAGPAAAQIFQPGSSCIANKPIPGSGGVGGLFQCIRGTPNGTIYFNGFIGGGSTFYDTSAGNFSFTGNFPLVPFASGISGAQTRIINGVGFNNPNSYNSSSIEGVPTYSGFYDNFTPQLPGVFVEPIPPGSPGGGIAIDANGQASIFRHPTDIISARDRPLTISNNPVHINVAGSQWRIAENEPPRPQDRVFVNYNYFTNPTGGGTGVLFQPTDTGNQQPADPFGVSQQQGPGTLFFSGGGAPGAIPFLIPTGSVYVQIPGSGGWQSGGNLSMTATLPDSILIPSPMIIVEPSVFFNPPTLPLPASGPPPLDSTGKPVSKFVIWNEATKSYVPDLAWDQIAPGSGYYYLDSDGWHNEQKPLAGAQNFQPIQLPQTLQTPPIIPGIKITSDPIDWRHPVGGTMINTDIHLYRQPDGTVNAYDAASGQYIGTAEKSQRFQGAWNVKAGSPPPASSTQSAQGPPAGAPPAGQAGGAKVAANNTLGNPVLLAVQSSDVATTKVPRPGN